jgi:hypothetical protein
MGLSCEYVHDPPTATLLPLLQDPTDVIAPLPGFATGSSTISPSTLKGLKSARSSNSSSSLSMIPSTATSSPDSHPQAMLTPSGRPPVPASTPVVPTSTPAVPSSTIDTVRCLRCRDKRERISPSFGHGWLLWGRKRRDGVAVGVVGAARCRADRGLRPCLFRGSSTASG